MILNKQKEADFISLQNINKIPLLVNNLYKLSFSIIQQINLKFKFTIKSW